MPFIGFFILPCSMLACGHVGRRDQRRPGFEWFVFGLALLRRPRLAVRRWQPAAPSELGGAFAEGLEARVVGDGADGDAQPGVHARLDALQRVELAGELERRVGGLVAAAVGDGVVDRAQRALERRRAGR